MKLSLRWKLVLVIGIPLLTVYLLLLGITHSSLKRNAMHNMERMMSSVARAYALQFDEEFSKIDQVADSTASFLTLSPDITDQEIYQLLYSNLDHNPLIYGSCIAFEPDTSGPAHFLFAPYVWRDPKSGEIRQMDIAKDAYDYRSWDWYKIPKDLQKPIWTEPYFDKGAGNVVMTTYSVPFYRDKKFWGIATVDIRLRDLEQNIHERFPMAEEFMIISREGRFIAHPSPRVIMKETIFSLGKQLKRSELEALGRKMIAGERGVERTHGVVDGGAMFLIYEPIPSTGWSLAAFVPESKVMAPVWKQIRRFSFMMLGGLAVILLILLITSYRITTPLRRLAAAVQQLAKGNLDIQIPGNYEKDEIGELAGAFNKMVNDLKNYIEAVTRETAARQMVESELDIARRIQTSLLPRTFPPFPHRKEFDLYALNKPARHVAGDFFDFFLADDNTLVFVLADVSGKGIPAAMFMAMTRTILRNLASTDLSPSQVFEKANQILARDNENGMFVTMFLGYYDIPSGRLRYANAGHLLPFRMGDGKSVRSFGKVTGPVLGCIENQSFQEEESVLEKGESILLYTDGATEARSPESQFFGEKRFSELVDKVGRESVEEQCQNIFKTLDRFQNHILQDDITLLILHRN
jgi:sigma-B regulation protein RsbU (phosphoserine phosphatase)